MERQRELRVLQEVRREDLADEAYKDRIIAALKEEPDVV